jgi:hypothetical protein
MSTSEMSKATGIALTRAPLIAAVLGGMAIGLYAGLVRLGLPLPSSRHLADIHGPLMICGVFGTLIALERAVAIGTRLAFTAPVLLALGGLALIAGLPETVTHGLLVGGAASFALATAWIMGQQRAVFTATLLAGALSLLAGTIAWSATGDVPAAAGAWLLFLVATIAAERLELSRALAGSRFTLPGFFLALGPLAIGATLGIGDAPGARLFGLGLIALTAWLAFNDIATRTIRMAGQTRFMASAMLAGYLWLPVAGLALIAAPEAVFAYDLVLHAVLIGFVLSMVFGHALIIFPSVARVPLRYHPALYVPLVLLHASVVIRVVGDLLEEGAVRTASGPLTLVALMGFAATLVVARRR